MGIDVRIVDEVWGDLQAQAKGEEKRRPAGQLKLVHSQATAREVIAQRARRDFADAKSRNHENISNPPLGTTRDEMLAELEGRARMPESEEIAIEIALGEFERGMVMLFWNGTQVTEHDENLDLLGDNEAVFVRLLPLVGG